MDTTVDQSLVEAEIRGLHADLALWLSGRCTADTTWFGTAFAERLHEAFFNVQPAGIVLTREDLLGDLESGYGVSEDFDIHIRNVTLRQVMDDGALLLATYEEYQRGANNSRSENARLSAVLFERRTDGRLIWRSIHETWLPEANHAAEHFAFAATEATI